MSLHDLKKLLRKKALRLRAEQADKDELSKKIMSNCYDLAEFQRSRTLLIYLDHKSEARTRMELETLLRSGKRVLVPFCEGDSLYTFWLKHEDELEPGSFDILEPAEELRRINERKIPIDEIDMVLVPGVAFDKNGGRLGYGKGYYDRFLSQVPMECTLVGLAYESQIFPEIPMSEYDMPLDIIVTEKATYTQDS